MKEFNLFTFQMQHVIDQIENLKKQGFSIENYVKFHQTRDENDKIVNYYVITAKIGDEKREIEFILQ